MASEKKLFLEQRVGSISEGHYGHHRWTVKRVVNSSKPRIGDTLDKEEVDAYCDREDWEVEIT